MNCSSCASEIPAGSRFCPSCGAALETPSQVPTRFTGRPSDPLAASPGGWSSSDSLDEGRFTAGVVVSDRYRIVGLLGRGGMGEVYRADDLRLGQPVALKFLPLSLARDAGRLARFHNEVRVARQVSHPNVCRVYDIGEADGQHYLSMEYVDGENLASLLKRIGRISRDKAVEIARQICAGIAAAHERGVIHRDLKPANVMLDGRGKVRITDFGLASLAGELSGDDVRVGTPSYMAPEQLAGETVSMRSDIYSLGLVLYELFTGKAAFKAGTMAELLRMHSERTPTSPSSLAEDIDPAVDRVISRCLEKDPRSRPASALAVAAALPGGDPLAAALAAGETPSPEMVAAAGTEGALRPSTAWVCLALVLVGAACGFFLTARDKLTYFVPLTVPPDVLEAKAREILTTVGHSDAAADTARGFVVDDDYLRYVREEDSSPTRWGGLSGGRPAAMQFWYRQSPRQMIPQGGNYGITYDQPPQTISGMASVLLDPGGRLIGLHVVPPQVDESEAPGPAADWSALFAAADLDPNAFTETRSIWVPPVNTDSRAAWEGALPEAPESPIRIEAAAYRGQPVFFRVLGPWTRPARMEETPSTIGQEVVRIVAITVFLAAMLGSILLARRNLRLGRGDRGGAFKLALFFIIIHVLVWACMAHHVTDALGEMTTFVFQTGSTLFMAAFVWLLYVGLEPFVRRHWPDTIISWSRILAGRFRDPLVGRDILFGCLFGVVILLLANAGRTILPWLGLPPPVPSSGELSSLFGLRDAVPRLIDYHLHAALNAMMALFVFLLLRLLLRKQWLAILAFFTIGTILPTVAAENPAAYAVEMALIMVCFLFVMIRFGLLAMTVINLFGASASMVLTTDLSAWYAGSSILVPLAWVGLAIYGFHTSLAGQPLFGSGILEE